jgi:hypothetical protein
MKPQHEILQSMRLSTHTKYSMKPMPENHMDREMKLITGQLVSKSTHNLSMKDRKRKKENRGGVMPTKLL